MRENIYLLELATTFNDIVLIQSQTKLCESIEEAARIIDKVKNSLMPGFTSLKKFL